MDVKVFKQKSTRLDKEGVPYTDLFVGWVHNSKCYFVRVHPSFKGDYKKLLAQAQEVPTGEQLEKYL